MDVAAWHIDAAGQRVQDGVCTGGLRGVGVLLEPGPGEVCQRPMMPEQMRGLPDGFGRRRPKSRRYPRADRRCTVRAKRAKAGRQAIGPSRPATENVPARASWTAARLVTPRSRIVLHGGAAPLVPGDKAALGAACGELIRVQQPAVVVAHQERTVGPVAHELGVEPAVLDHYRRQSTAPARRRSPAAPAASGRP